MTPEQLPPNAIDLEEAVLGALMLEKNALTEVIGLLNVDSFYSLEHRQIYESILNINKAGQPIDILTVTHDLRKRQVLQMVGGPGYISRLTNKVASAAHLEYHAMILKEKETARKYNDLSYRLRDMALNPSFEIHTANDFAIDQVQKIINIGNIKKHVSNMDLAHEFVERVHLAKTMGGITGIPTGFWVYDRLTGGHQKGNLIVWAARPGMGKTALAICAQINAALQFKKRVAIFSLEMRALELFQRMCAIHMNIDSNKFKSGDMSIDEWKYFNENLEPLLGDRIVIIDDCRSLQEIRTRIKKEKMVNELDEVIIDYLQLMSAGTKGGNREQEISTISQGLKATAMEVEIPIIALAQLSRSVETRGGDMRPRLSDLRESGAIEQDADIVCFLYRPNYYDKAAAGEENLAWFIVAKHRNGGLRDVELKYIHEMTKFLNPDQTQMPF